MDLIQENNICPLLVSNLESYHSMYSKNTKLQAALVNPFPAPVRLIAHVYDAYIYFLLNMPGIVRNNGHGGLQIFAGFFLTSERVQENFGRPRCYILQGSMYMYMRLACCNTVYCAIVWRRRLKQTAKKLVCGNRAPAALLIFGTTTCCRKNSQITLPKRLYG
jgi:hypothetical protein